MNIKSITGIQVPQDVKKTEKRTQDTSADRDAQQQDGGQQERKKMTPEELLKAIDYLKALKGVAENNLRVRLDQSSDTAIIFIEDSSGKVVRRIPETDLWLLMQEKDKSKGHLFDKAM